MRRTLTRRFSGLQTFESLRIRDYRLLWLGQISTSMGQWMDQVTRGWLIYQLTGSPLQLGLATATRGFPLLLFGIVAGAYADRSGRKMQLIVAQVTNAGLNVVLATLVLTHHVHPWHVYTTGFLAGTVQAFQQPARQTLVSDLVGNERLMNALALNSAALNSSRTLGPAFAGIFISSVGVAGSYYLQGALYAFATLWTGQMHVPERTQNGRNGEREPFFASIRAGFSYVGTNPNIRTLMMLALGPLTFGMSYTSLMPVVARNILHGGAPLQGLLLSCIGVGSLIGALIVASMRRSNGYGLPVVIGATCFSLAIIGFGSSQWIPVSLFLGFTIGLFNVTYQTQNQTLLQVMVPRHIRGRVMSIYLLNRGFVPLGALLAGALASHFGGAAALRIMASTALVIIFLVVATHPQLLRLKVPFDNMFADEGAEPETEGDRPESGRMRRRRSADSAPAPKV
jgi:MFS family permease